MTGSGDESSGADGGGDDETVDADDDLDELQPVSTSLRSAQHGGREIDESADAVEEQSDPDAPEADPDGLDEPVPVSSSLRSAQSRAGAGDIDAAGDDGMEASDAEESGDA
jgi:hypothetical protein